MGFTCGKPKEKVRLAEAVDVWGWTTAECKMISGVIIIRCGMIAAMEDLSLSIGEKLSREHSVKENFERISD